MQGKSKANRIITLVIIIILALLFTFPLYWIITGSFKTAKEVNSVTPVWWPSEWTLKNYQTLMSKLKAPLWEFYVPFSQYFSADGNPVAFSVGPTVPGAIRWMLNTVWMAVAAMLLTCVTSALAGYALAKKRFVGRTLIFTLIVCAMALPKQVILIPLIREMSSLKLYNTLSAVIYPIVGWPFGVFLIKQFAESIPGEILEAARIDGANTLVVFFRIILPLSKPIVATVAVFCFIGVWNDYIWPSMILPYNQEGEWPLYPIQAALTTIQSIQGITTGEIMASLIVTSIPIFIIYVLAQKYIVQGFGTAGLKM